MEVNVMTHFEGHRFVSIFIALVAVFVLGQAVPANAGGPPDLALSSKVQLNQAEQTGALNASKALLTQHFGSEMAQNLATRADTKILRRTQNGYEGEMLVLGLEKANYTAKMSRLEFAVENGQAKVKGIQKNFSPSFNQAPAPVPSNPQVQQTKAKLNINKGGAAPEDIRQFNAAALVRAAEEAEAREPHHSWWAARGLANTSAPEFPSAVTYTNYIHAVMYSRWGGSAAKRIGTASSKAEINDFLGKDYNLLAWNNIGHGVTGTSSTGVPLCYGLVQSGGTLWYYDFTSTGMNPGIGLYHAVALTNSCKSFRQPLNNYIWYRQPRTYIGGNINLPVGRSEQTAYHFWYYTLKLNWPMGAALTKAQTDLGFPVGTFGLRGYNGVF
jgi:hypothetical protein